MKQYVKYKNSLVPGKISSEVRISVDDNRSIEYSSEFDGNKSTSLTFFPIVSVNIIKPSEIGENGQKVRAPWNPNDSLGMTKYNLPIFIRELKNIQNGMTVKNLYTYQGKRLELNEEAAEKIRNVFMIGNVTIELSAIVIIQPDDSRIEGIKMKFNNEQSSVLLTINELEVLIFNLDHLDVDTIAMLLYLNYVKTHNTEYNNSINNSKANVDIIPKEFKE